MPSSSANNCVAVVGLLQSTKILIYSAPWIIISKKITFTSARSAEFATVLFRREAACAIGTQCRWHTHNNREAIVVRGPPVAKRPSKLSALVYTNKTQRICIYLYINKFVCMFGID